MVHKILAREKEEKGRDNKEEKDYDEGNRIYTG